MLEQSFIPSVRDLNLEVLGRHYLIDRGACLCEAEQTLGVVNIKLQRCLIMIGWSKVNFQIEKKVIYNHQKNDLFKVGSFNVDR